MARLAIASSFVEDMEAVHSKRMQERIFQALESLQAFPELGMVDRRPEICARFSGTVRKLVIGPFDLFYRHCKERDEVRVVALLDQRSIRR